MGLLINMSTFLILTLALDEPKENSNSSILYPKMFNKFSLFSLLIYSIVFICYLLFVYAPVESLVEVQHALVNACGMYFTSYEIIPIPASLANIAIYLIFFIVGLGLSFFKHTKYAAAAAGNCIPGGIITLLLFHIRNPLLFIPIFAIYSIVLYITLLLFPLLFVKIPTLLTSSYMFLLFLRLFKIDLFESILSRTSNFSLPWVSSIIVISVILLFASLPILINLYISPFIKAKRLAATASSAKEEAKS